jgi:type I restriction enzyme R subunit
LRVLDLPAGRESYPGAGPAAEGHDNAGRAVLDALLDKYADHGIADIEDPKVLELPPFDRIGSETRIRRGIFGGPDKVSKALTELERQLYQDRA